MAAHALAGAGEKALAAGCDEFDIKPVEFDRLLTKMCGVLGSWLKLFLRERIRAECLLQPNGDFVYAIVRSRRRTGLT